MTKEDLFKLKEDISKLNHDEEIERDLYLKRLATGEIAGPSVGYLSIDKPWLRYYEEYKIKKDIPKMSLYSYLYEQNKDYLGRNALSYFGKKITFQELFDKINETAKALKAMGVKENEIVTISMPNTPEAVYLLYAISKIGAVANMVDPRTSTEGIERYIDETGTDKVIIIDTHYEKIKPLIERKINKVVAVSPTETFALKPNDYHEKHTESWGEFIQKGRDYKGIVEAEYEENRPTIIEHTGGTTGLPKSVLLTNENINAVVLQSVYTGIDMQRQHNWLDIMPTFIAYGVATGLHLPLTIGMEVILIPAFDPQKFDDLLVENRPIHMVGVPSYWGTIVKSEKLKNEDLSYIIAPTVGGDAMDVSLEEEANEFLKKHNCTSKIVKGYGMTEVAGAVVGTVDENNEIGSVGIPFVKETLAIFEPGTEEELGYRENGEICITGPNTMLGYFQNQKATDAVLKRHADGKIWVHTGDIGYMNENGSIFLVDRLKRMMIRYDGFKIFPSLIEKVIEKNESIEACKVVAIADEEHRQGKLPKVHVVLKEEYKGKEAQIREELEKLCEECLPEYCQPADYKFRENLPLTPVGKIDYLALEKEDEDIQNKKSNKVLIKK